jgi:hypothetical protein
MKMKFKARYLIIIAFVAVLSLLAIQSAQAQQETCPATGDWVKIEPIDAQSYLYTAPEGKLVAEVCYKAGTTVKYETIDPEQASINITTDVPNPNDNSFQNISHASFRLVDEPKEEEVYASVSIGVCDYDNENGSLINVELTVKNAIITIDGKQYTTSQTIQLPPGDYTWTWVAAEGFSGSGSGSITLFDCDPSKGSVSVDIAECNFDGQNGSLINVVLTIDNAILTINGKEYTESQTIQLPPGEYEWSWVAGEGFSGSGGDTILLEDCDPSKADVSLDLSACEVVGDQTQRTLSIVIDNAIFTINGKEYTESTTIKLTPGDYPWSWQAASDEFEGSGEGVLSFVSTCNTESRDPDPDVAAGGMGPSFVNSVAPLLAGVAGLGLASIFVFKGKKEN